MPQMTVTTVVNGFKHLRFTVAFNIPATSKCLHLVSADLCQRLQKVVLVSANNTHSSICLRVCVRLCVHSHQFVSDSMVKVAGQGSGQHFIKVQQYSTQSPSHAYTPGADHFIQSERQKGQTPMDSPINL